MTLMLLVCDHLVIPQRPPSDICRKSFLPEWVLICLVLSVDNVKGSRTFPNLWPRATTCYPKVTLGTVPLPPFATILLGRAHDSVYLLLHEIVTQ